MAVAARHSEHWARPHRRYASARVVRLWPLRWMSWIRALYSGPSLRAAEKLSRLDILANCAARTGGHGEEADV